MSVITEIFGFKKAIEKISPDYFKSHPSLLELLATILLLFMFKGIFYAFLKDVKSSIYALVAWLLYLFWYVYSIKKSEVAVYLNGITQVVEDFPKYIFSRIRSLTIKSVIFGCDKSSTTEKLIEQLYLDYGTFNTLISNKKIEKLYVGGLCRIPFLCAYGAFFHNISAEIVMIEKFHDGKWTFLNDKTMRSQKIQIDTVNSKLNSDNEIALLVSFSLPIDISSIPSKLQNSYSHMYVKNCSRNLFMDTKSINQAVNTIIQEIDRINSTIKPSIIHLFLSVQTTVALKIGSRIQSGMHPIIQIHNFDAQTKSYPWSLKIMPMETDIKSKITLINN
ncbi:MAG: SAVED domain-containing protein [Neisseriaceae bacterium]|nr:MAG: SAVED domain-containing protein [Neisseriaceae bacterium]